MKLVLLVRTDLEMGKGKIAAQCCHAAVGVCRELTADESAAYDRANHTKIVLRVNGGEAELLERRERAKRAGLRTYLVEDAGHTQVDPGTRTVLAIGPGPDGLVDSVTGDLRLL